MGDPLRRGLLRDPVVLLARPDGSDYPWVSESYRWVEHERRNALRLIEVDWNADLRGARARAQTKRRLAAAISESAALLTPNELRWRSRYVRKERERLDGWLRAMCDYSYANQFSNEARQDAKAALDAADRWLATGRSG